MRHFAYPQMWLDWQMQLQQSLLALQLAIAASPQGDTGVQDVGVTVGVGVGGFGERTMALPPHPPQDIASSRTAATTRSLLRAFIAALVIPL
jgi:hypothetical protein